MLYSTKFAVQSDSSRGLLKEQGTERTIPTSANEKYVKHMQKQEEGKKEFPN